MKAVAKALLAPPLFCVGVVLGWLLNAVFDRKRSRYR